MVQIMKIEQITSYRTLTYFETRGKMFRAVVDTVDYKVESYRFEEFINAYVGYMPCEVETSIEHIVIADTHNLLLRKYVETIRGRTT